MLKIKLPNNLYTFIDQEDYLKVCKFKWHVSNGAVIANIKLNNKRTTIKLHRLILNLKPYRPIVDHINGNPLDNRKKNLRLCTHSQNLMNRPKNVNNKSGYKGVFWSNAAKKWTAQICINGEKKHLGLFNTPEEAHRSYSKSALDIHKEFARIF